MAQDLLDKQLVEAVLAGRPRRTKAEIEEARLASKRPAKAGVAVVAEPIELDDEDDDDDSRPTSSSGRRPRVWSTRAEEDVAVDVAVEGEAAGGSAARRRPGQARREASSRSRPPRSSRRSPRT